MTDPTVRFQQVALVGLGLIGSSLGWAIKRAALAETIIGVDADADALAEAAQLGFIDAGEARLEAAVENADLVVLCTPVGAAGAIAERLCPAMKPGAILTDVGSVKSEVVRAVSSFVPSHVDFVPAHPVAGTEQSGPSAGFASLFDNRWCIVTPLDAPQGDADRYDQAVQRVCAFWRAVGAAVEVMSPEHHDRVLAVTSHLPHLIAYTIVGTADDLAEVTQSEVIKFSAGGFRDFTRIAASDPTMWRDVFLHNRPAMLELLGRFTEDLIALQRAIRWGQGDALFDHFSRTRAIRRGILEIGQDVATPDFGRRASED